MTLKINSKVLILIAICVCIFSGSAAYHSLMKQDTKVVCDDMRITSDNGEEINPYSFSNLSEMKEAGNVDCLNLDVISEPYYKKVFESIIHRNSINKNLITYVFSLDSKNLVLIIEYIIFLSTLIIAITFMLNKIVKRYKCMGKNILSIKYIGIIFVSILSITFAQLVFKISWNYNINQSLSIFIVSILSLFIYIVYHQTFQKNVYELDCVICDVEENNRKKGFNNQNILLVRDIHNGEYYTILSAYRNKYRSNEYVYFHRLIPSDIEDIDFEIDI